LRHRIPLRSLLFVIAALLFVCDAASFHASAQDVMAYKNPELSVDQRVADLLARMMLEEKLAQIDSAWENRAFQREAQPFIVDEKGVFLPDSISRCDWAGIHVG